jgi:hypothetical protein
MGSACILRDRKLSRADVQYVFVVLIDDASSDSTLDIFEDLKNYTQYPFGKVRNNEAFWGNKKYALTLGIKAAKKRIFIIY